jgi:hypothetical protein
MTAAGGLSFFCQPVLPGKGQIIGPAIYGKLDDAKTATNQIKPASWLELSNNLF